MAVQQWRQSTLPSRAALTSSVLARVRAEAWPLRQWTAAAKISGASSRELGGKPASSDLEVAPAAETAVVETAVVPAVPSVVVGKLIVTSVRIVAVVRHVLVVRSSVLVIEAPERLEEGVRDHAADETHRKAREQVRAETHAATCQR